ncbi:MAG: sigma-54 dependent transcriptional regulator [Verrucomicrobiota bacterium]
MASRPRILVVDPDEAEASILTELLEGAEMEVMVVSTAEAAVERAETGAVDAVVVERHLPDSGGLGLVKKLHATLPRLPIVMVTGSAESEVAIEAIKLGACDFLVKPVDPEEFTRVMRESVAVARRSARPVKIGTVAEHDDSSLIGQSRAMADLYKQLGRIAATPASVLIRGETGTGKELIARALYQHGHRAHQPFVAVNCAAIPENLLESELFGHEKGAFTGAVATRVGRFEQAHNATLFLDEIGDLDLTLQSKLLRVLQERQIQRVGGRVDIPVDARILAATHRNLEEMMREGAFREDLFYRLNVATIRIPPLREREGDIPLLVDHFLALFGREYGLQSPSVTEAGLRYLDSCAWPGNVRQLQNVIRKALLKVRNYAIDEPDLREILSDEQAGEAESPESSLEVLVSQTVQRAIEGEITGAHRVVMEKAERALLAEAMKLSDGNKAKAARWLGISRLTLREKLQRYGI